MEILLIGCILCSVCFETLQSSCRPAGLGGRGQCPPAAFVGLFLVLLVLALGFWVCRRWDECMVISERQCPCTGVYACVSAGWCPGCFVVWLCFCVVGVRAVLPGLCVVPSCHPAWFSVLPPSHYASEFGGLCTVVLHHWCVGCSTNFMLCSILLGPLRVSCTVYSRPGAPLPGRICSLDAVLVLHCLEVCGLHSVAWMYVACMLYYVLCAS